jgi:TatD DNase family protein
MQLYNMIDNHCHMSQTTKKEPAAMQMLDVALSEGLFAFIDAGDIVQSPQERLDALSAYERGFLVVGQHPLDIDQPFPYEQMLGILEDPKVVGIGEIGLDYSRGSDKAKQQVAFESQLVLADRYDLPAMLHVRDAFEDAYQLVRRIGIPRLVVHCFTGDKTEAKRWLDLGAYLSFSGLITFQNASEIQESLCYAPTDRILLETDAPYLSPHPLRGKTNHPQNMGYIYQRATELKNVPLDNLVLQVKQNFKDLYRLHYLGD